MTWIRNSVQGKLDCLKLMLEFINFILVRYEKVFHNDLGFLRIAVQSSIS